MAHVLCSAEFADARPKSRRVVRAAAMGMCFGVRDALAAARAVPEPARVTIHGELVHNAEVLRELDARGFKSQAESNRDRLPETPTVLITAHGVSERERGRLLAAGKDLVDTTCPLVRFVHEQARMLHEHGYLVIVLGRAGHVEVAGIVGDLERYEVVGSEDDVRCWPVARIGVVSQSTTPPERAVRLIDRIRALNPGSEVRAIDTICGPTRNRQEAARALLDEVEAVVVVGGRHSNNTRELLRLAQDRGVPALLVETVAEVDRDWISRYSVIGLTAGTSTLDATIEAVERAIESVA